MDYKVPVIVKPFYKVFLQQYNGKTIVHCDVSKWSKEIAKALQHDFDLLVYLHDDPIFALHDIEDDKHKKFLQLYNFSFVERVLGADLKFRELYVRK